MDFDLSEEQGQFKDAIDRLVRSHYGFEQRRRYAAEPGGWSREFWTQLADSGFLALPFDPAHGGLGGNGVDTMLVMEALGRGLCLEPYLASVIVAGAVLRHSGSEAQLETEVPQIAAGTRVLALASSERQSRHHLADVATTARAGDEGWVLNGEKIVVTHGDSADAFIVSARTGSDLRSPDGISLFLLDANFPGISMRGYRTQDGLHAADLLLRDVRVPADRLLGLAGQGFAALERGAQAGIAALAAESVGAMQAALDMTVDYLKQRQQFGGPIGRFQALQHHAADMLVALEQARSMALYAALMLDHADPAERRRALSSVKVEIGRSGRLVGQLAVQSHGGIGVTEEYAVGHYFKRLTMIDALFGDGEFHLDRLMEAA